MIDSLISWYILLCIGFLSISRCSCMVSISFRRAGPVCACFGSKIGLFQWSAKFVCLALMWLEQRQRSHYCWYICKVLLFYINRLITLVFCYWRHEQRILDICRRRQNQRSCQSWPVRPRHGCLDKRSPLPALCAIWPNLPFKLTHPCHTISSSYFQ